MNQIDQFPLWAVLVLCTVSQVLFIEAGFRFGRHRQSTGVKAQLAQVRAIMGASLGLLAFMLAFTFSMTQNHFEERSRAYMLEVSAIDSAFRGADLLEPDDRVLAQDLLKRFAALRIQTTEAARSADIDRVIEMVRESERIHDLLWALATSSMERSGDGVDAGMYAQSILTMINAHDARLQATVFNRVSPVIWVTLFLMALLSMVVMGYQAGLTGTRSTLATWTLAVTFSVVMTLITDLDRPNMRLFKLNQSLMVELENRMAEEMSPRPGTLPH